MDKLDTSEQFYEDKPYIKGNLEIMIFHNEQNLFSVARIKIIETTESIEEKSVIITGCFPKIHEDETYTFYGRFTEHPRFGMQYSADFYRKELPETKEGIIQYLSSDLFKGIGKKTAETIILTLGDKAISRILTDKNVLNEVPKLSKEKAELLYETLKHHQGLEQIMIGLSKYGFGPQLSAKIYKVYKEEALDIIQNNPYQLIEDIEGIGFGRADTLARATGIPFNNPLRLRAACLFLLNNVSIQEGHVYIEKMDLCIEAQDLLCEGHSEIIELEEISQEMICLVEEGKIIEEEDRMYLPSLYFAEKGFVTNIKKIIDNENNIQEFPESEFLKSLGALEDRIGVTYALQQKDAIKQAISSSLMLLTGGPGTGKTTVIKGIVEVFADLHGLSLNIKEYKNGEAFPILLVAPTGRAAKRMSEATGLPALTIHRLLGWTGEQFDHDEESPIEGKLIIVDEVSMVDIWLVHQLFKSLPSTIQIVLVGDEDQLPSVGPGQVLRDLLASNVMPVVHLTEIYRQAKGSSIIDLAHHIKNGRLPADFKDRKSDRVFFPCRQEQVVELVQKICGNALNKGYKARDVQVLAPMYRGSAGIDQLNRTLQQLFNPFSEQKRQLKFKDIIFRTGDKVLQLVNKPENQVFNGDIGEIVHIVYEKENVEKMDQVVISFDGIEVTYMKNDLNQITHAYCCSVHKAQGSEFPIVIFPVVKGYYRMLKRNLIYTAITRSKESLVLCGEIDALNMGINRFEKDERKTSLVQRLMENFYTGDINESTDFIMEVDEKGMENVSPYDFM